MSALPGAPMVRSLAMAAAAGGITQLALRAASRLVPRHVVQRLDRRNFSGETVSLLEGPAVVAGAAGALFLAGRPVTAVATTAVGIVGAFDDLAGSSAAKGLGGHLRALAHGRVTTGSVKVAGVGLASAAVTWRGQRDARWVADTLTVAGTANLANLFDLRPGRAIKVAVTAAIPMFGSPPAAAAVGAALAAAPGDLAGRTMLGDTGANALGALVGIGLTGLRTPPVRSLALATVLGLTLISERVSFSAAIDANPVLRAIDRWGRA